MLPYARRVPTRGPPVARADDRSLTGASHRHRAPRSGRPYHGRRSPDRRCRNRPACDGQRMWNAGCQIVQADCRLVFLGHHGQSGPLIGCAPSGSAQRGCTAASIRKALAGQILSTKRDMPGCSVGTGACPSKLRCGATLPRRRARPPRSPVRSPRSPRRPAPARSFRGCRYRRSRHASCRRPWRRPRPWRCACRGPAC